MNDILNVRVKRLIRDDLLTYGKHLLGLIGLGLIGLFMVRVIFSGFEGFGTFIENAIQLSFDFFSFGFFVFFIGISGIVSGAELPQYVRRGLTRKDYFMGVTIASAIVSLFITPILLVFSMVINFLPVNVEVIISGDILNLLLQFLVYFPGFLIGFSIAIIWQRLGWLISVMIITVIFGMLGVLGWNLFSWADGITIEAYAFTVTWSISLVYSSAIATVLVVIFGGMTYVLVRGIPIKTR